VELTEQHVRTILDWALTCEESGSWGDNDRAVVETLLKWFPALEEYYRNASGSGMLPND
jgi:hypothetical protein